MRHKQEYKQAISLTSSGRVAPPSFAFNSLLGCVIVFLEVGALCWVGLWFGLRAKGQARAIVQTIVLVKVLPYSIYALYQILLHVLVRSWSGYWGTPYWIMSWLPQVVGLLFYLVLIRLARHRLLGELAGADPTPLDFRQAISAAARHALAVLRKARHWTPS